MSSVNVSPYNREVKVRGPRVEIHDTTLREGEQAPGIVFKADEKVKIAGMLFEMGVDRIEAGFPASSRMEYESVRRIVGEYGDKGVFGFARAVKRDIDSVIGTGAGGVLLSFPPSEIHLKYKLRITKEEYLRRATECVEYSKEHGLKVIFSAEDATRASYEWLSKVFRTLWDVGVDVCRIADTVGCILPSAMHALVSRLIDEIGCEIEVHCHNDHGLALANSLAAYEAGATGISSSVLGLGERTGIAATEELVVALHNLYGVKKYKIGMVGELCDYVARVAGIKVHPAKPVIGDYAFTHYSGIHQDGVLKNPIVYESYSPELVGRRRKILVGAVSGRSVIKAKLREMGIELDDDELYRLSMKIKELAFNRRSAFADEELVRILKDLGVIK